MAKTTRQLLADAHQKARDLSNELHLAKQGNLPLRGEVVGLTSERDLLVLKVKSLITLNEHYRHALTGLVELLHVLAGGKT
jgi:hypothetical protein